MSKDVTFRFIADFDHSPLPGQTVAYLAGMEVPIPETVAAAAQAAGAGEPITVSEPAAKKSAADEGRGGSQSE